MLDLSSPAHVSRVPMESRARAAVGNPIRSIASAELQIQTRQFGPEVQNHVVVSLPSAAVPGGMTDAISSDSRPRFLSESITASCEAPLCAAGIRANRYLGHRTRSRYFRIAIDEIFRRQD